MEKATHKGTNHKLPNGAFLKKVIDKNMPEKEEMDQMIDRVTRSIPKVTKFLKANWKPVAIATASVAVVALGAFSLLGKTKAIKKS